jgi:hypothetical protein
MDDWDDPTPAVDSDSGDSGDEAKVRRYLEFVADPSSALDEQRIAELEGKIAAAADPIEKIHLASDLHRARQGDGDRLRREFVAAAKRWATAEGIVPDAFRVLGVGDEELRAAGFDLGAAPRRRAEVGTVGSGTRSRAPRVTSDEIRSAAMAFEGPFTIADLRDRAGGSPATVRKALDDMVSEGLVRALGATPDWGGPGRPPHRFEVAPSS